MSVCLSAIEIKLETFRYKQTYESYITFSREAKYGILISIRIVYGGLRAYTYSTYIKILELSKVFVRYHKQKKFVTNKNPNLMVMSKTVFLGNLPVVDEEARRKHVARASETEKQRQTRRQVDAHRQAISRQREQRRSSRPPIGGGQANFGGPS